MAGGVVVLELIEGADTVGSKATDQAKKNKSYSVQMQGRQTKKARALTSIGSKTVLMSQLLQQNTAAANLIMNIK